MKTQILPNYCKIIGLILFITFSFIGSGDDFIDGFNSGAGLLNEGSDLFKSYFGIELLHYFDIISFIGMLIYAVSKEKIEDDYITKLRLESYQLTAIIGLILSIILYTFFESIKLTLDYFIILYIWCYLLIFFIKKRLY